MSTYATWMGYLMPDVIYKIVKTKKFIFRIDQFSLLEDLCKIQLLIHYLCCLKAGFLLMKIGLKINSKLINFYILIIFFNSISLDKN